MNTTQSWVGLPDHIKRQAAPDMLAGKTWMYWGNIVENPGADELRQWADIAPQSPQEGAEVAGSITAAEPGISQGIAHTREGISGDIAHARPREGKREKYARARETMAIAHARPREGKRQAVDSALTANPDASNREIARKLGVSHTFIAMRRRKAGNVSK